MDKITFARVAVTVTCFLCFLGLTYWAFSKKNVKMMEDLGKSVIEEDDHMEHDGGNATVPKKAKV